MSSDRITLIECDSISQMFELATKSIDGVRLLHFPINFVYRFRCDNSYGDLEESFEDVISFAKENNLLRDTDMYNPGDRTEFGSRFNLFSGESDSDKVYREECLHYYNLYRLNKYDSIKKLPHQDFLNICSEKSDVAIFGIPTFRVITNMSKEGGEDNPQHVDFMPDDADNLFDFGICATLLTYTNDYPEQQIGFLNSRFSVKKGDVLLFDSTLPHGAVVHEHAPVRKLINWQVANYKNKLTFF